MPEPSADPALGARDYAIIELRKRVEELEQVVVDLRAVLDALKPEESDE